LGISWPLVKLLTLVWVRHCTQAPSAARPSSLWLLRRHIMLYVRRHIMLYVTRALPGYASKFATLWLKSHGGCFMGATPRGRQGSPALTLLHMSDGPRVLFGRRCCGRSAGPPYVSALPISAQRVA